MAAHATAAGVAPAEMHLEPAEWVQYEPADLAAAELRAAHAATFQAR
jgi:hypothetical protein